MTEAHRPFVQLATVCQTVLQENNGSLSVIRITDRIGVQGNTPEMQPFPLQNFVLAVILKAGFMRGKYVVKLAPVTPSEKPMPALEMTVLFEGDERGVQLLMPLQIIVQEEGLYWFDVYVEQDLLTRIPLRVIYQRVPQVPGMQQPPPTS